MLIKVIQPFCGFGFNMPTPGSLLEVSEEAAAHLASIGAVEPYQTKVDPLPEEVKKESRSASSRPGRAPRKRTRKSSRKSAKKS